MRDHYDFAKLKPATNPFAVRATAAQRKKPVTIRLGMQTVEYFKQIAQENGLPYQRVINLYLDDCAAHGKKLNVTWHAPKAPPSQVP